MDKNEEKTGEIVLYQPEGAVKLEVRVENETVWLNRQQMTLLFDRDIKTIGKHIANALREECQNSVVAKFATTADDGKIYQVEHYDLDLILSVGYRVKSANGVKFRRWASEVLKDYLLKGYAVQG
ncbi:MAG: virulence RhuM family protein [Fibrobacter sp.]|nr:virulence RhuM family protein [Fibrobacter sp.]